MGGDEYRRLTDYELDVLKAQAPLCTLAHQAWQHRKHSHSWNRLDIDESKKSCHSLGAVLEVGYDKDVTVYGLR